MLIVSSWASATICKEAFHAQDYECMACTNRKQDNVIQLMIPGAPRPGDNPPPHATEDTGLANVGCTYSTSAESIANEHFLTAQSESLVTDQLVICVICLELIDEAATALPCRHDHFHFSCIGTWLQQNRACPLCKASIVSVRYHDRDSNSTSTFHLPELDAFQPVPRHRHRPLRSRTRRTPSHASRRDSTPEAESPAVRFRRRVYERGLYSLYVGNNRFSRYRNVTPALIASDSTLQSRAKKWIRRELRVLVPSSEHSFSPSSSASPSHGNVFRNNEFLLEYIIAILINIDIKGSAGQAEVLLKEHLGRKNARLFLHELENWMRSPFETLEEWDNFVQYPEMRCS